MPNSYFQFKQFIVNQERSAMKVTTDACLFGAWLATQDFAKTKNILDIGAGTGLLMLMIAQRSDADITGVEIDEDAYTQCSENIMNSPWAGRLKVIHDDIRNFTPDRKFGLIVSNPPFYQHQLMSRDIKKNIAHHQASLDFEEMFSKVCTVLEPDGFFAVLAPYSATEKLKTIGGRHSYFLFAEIKLKQTPAHQYFRTILVFQDKKTDAAITGEIIVKDVDGNYTDSFSILLKDYYLKL